MRAPLLFLTLLLSTSSFAASGIPEHWTRTTPPFEIFDDVYWVGTEGLAAYLFDTGDGLILLDTGMPQNATDVEASIRALGFAVEDVKILLNSHAHFDHCGGHARLKADTGATFIASASDREALETGTYPGWEALNYLDFPPVTVDRVIDDGETIVLGDTRLTAYLTPGHSAGCTSWGFDARTGGETVRALVFCSASVALNRLAPDPQYPGIVEAYRATFARLRDMEVDAWLMPHAEQFDLPAKRARLAQGAANPFVDPGEKDRRMVAFEAAFEAALAEQRAAQ